MQDILGRFYTGTGKKISWNVCILMSRRGRYASASRREFFHINSHGGAEPCPFSPYSDINVKDTSFKEAIRSRLFASLRDNHVLEAKHEGGCVLFSERETVQAIVSGMHSSAE